MAGGAWRFAVILSAASRGKGQDRVNTLQRYLFRQFTTRFLAVAAVLFLITLGALFTDLIREIALGKMPVGLLVSQLLLRSTRFFPMVLPLALFIGLILAISRLYAENEMAVMASAGVSPRGLLAPMAALALPVVVLIGLFSLWWGPAAERVAQSAVAAANRSFLLAGLEPGRFVELPGGRGVLYVGEMSSDGKLLGDLFLYNDREGRVDVVTARSGQLSVKEEDSRKLRLNEGFRVEGEPGRKDFRMLRFARNYIEVPEPERKVPKNLLAAAPLTALIGNRERTAVGELHWRLGPPLLALALAMWALPLSRSPPRQQRYGRMLLALLLYVLGMNLLTIASSWLADGSLPGVLGLWWLHLPLLAFVVWQVMRDGRLESPKRGSR